jgi:hypothetical protein
VFEEVIQTIYVSAFLGSGIQTRHALLFSTCSSLVQLHGSLCSSLCREFGSSDVSLGSTNAITRGERKEHRGDLSSHGGVVSDFFFERGFRLELKLSAYGVKLEVMYDSSAIADDQENRV